jgi:hypothetical protein
VAPARVAAVRVLCAAGGDMHSLVATEWAGAGARAGARAVWAFGYSGKVGAGSYV